MLYAIKHADQWIEIFGDFQSGEGDELVNYPPGWLDAASDQERAAIGVAAIVEDEQPDVDQRITGARLIDRAGVPTRKWITEPVPADELIAAARAAIDARAAAAFVAGYAPTHPALVGERLQVRDGEDRTNWLTSQASYAAAVSAGFGDVVDASFRTAGNRTITVSYADGLKILLGMAGWGHAIMGRAWALKDAAAAGDPIDLDVGWPA